MSPAHHAPPSGFTLVEAMTVLAVMAALACVALPSFVHWQRDAQLGATANMLRSALNLARSEAMKRGVPATLERRGRHWTEGLRVYADLNLDGRLDADEPVLLDVPAHQMPAAIAVVDSADTPRITFEASGFLRMGGTTRPGSGATTFTLRHNDATPGATVAMRRIILSPSGRIRVCRPADADDARCAAGGGA